MVLVLALAFIGLVALYLLASDETAGSLAAGPGPGSEVTEASSAGSEGALAPSDEARTGTPSPGTRTRTLASRGRIRGTVYLGAGLAAPESIEIVLSPSRYLDPGEAELRRTELPAGELDFDFSDLSLGNYDVAARAPGTNNVPVPATLVPESAEVVVAVSLSAAGTITGSIVHEGNFGALGIDVRLRDATGNAVASTTTDEYGEWELTGVPDGSYEIVYGTDQVPVLRPEKVAFRAPTMHLPPRVLPPSGRVTFEVVDSDGLPVEGAQLTGSGSNGGVIDHPTDIDGRATISGLPAGNYRVWANKPGLPRNLGLFELRSTEHPICRIVLR